MKRLFVLLCCVASAPGLFAQDVRINEILADSFDKNSRGHPIDHIELYNTTSAAIDLSGWKLTDSTGDNPFLYPPKYTFAQGTTIAPNSYLVVDLDPDIPTNSFGLQATGDAVYLFDPQINLRDVRSFGIQVHGLSFGYVDGQWTLTANTLGFANRREPLGDQRDLRINEWSGDGKDFIEVYNTSSNAVQLDGLRLADSTYFSKGSWQQISSPGSFVGTGKTNGFVVFEKDGRGYTYLEFGLSKDTDDAIYLAGSDGGIIQQVTTHALPENNTSEGFVPDGTTTNQMFFVKRVTKGKPNFGLLTKIVINELLSHTDAPFEDAVEFLNVTDEPINMGGWYMTDNPEKHMDRFVFPSTAVVPAHGYYVLYEYQFRNKSNPTNYTFNSAHGDTNYIFEVDDSGNAVAYLEQRFPSAANGVSFGRITNSDGDVDFVPMEYHTFGVDRPRTVQEFRKGKGAPNTSLPKWGPAIISEINYNPFTARGLNDPMDEYIEIRNVSGATLPLYDPAHPTNHWRLYVGGEDPNNLVWEFTAKDSIPRDGYLLVVGFDPSDVVNSNAFRAIYANSVPGGIPGNVRIIGPNTNRLGSGTSGDIVALYRPDPPQIPPHPDAGYVPYIRVDRVHYQINEFWPSDANGTGKSLQRTNTSGYADEPHSWFDDWPTPGRPNARPIIVRTQPASHPVLLHGNTVFSVEVEGTTPQYRWYFKNRPILPLAAATNGTLTLSNVIPAKAGLYSCVITNFGGKVTTSNATLTVIRPVIVKLLSRNTTAKEGTRRVAFRAAATGSGPITYQWTHDGQDIATNLNPTAASRMLVLTNLTADMAGNYAVRAWNVLSTNVSANTVSLAVTPR